MATGLFEEFEHLPQRGFVDQPFALVDLPDEDAESEVCADACQKEAGADQQGGGDGAFVHLVLQDHHIVDGMRKSRKQGQLQHEQHAAGVYAFAGTVLE